MNWIDQMNEDMASRREEFKKIDKVKLAKSYANKVSKSTDKGKEQEANWRLKGQESYMQLPEEIRKEQAIIRGKKGGPIGGKIAMSKRSYEEKVASAKHIQSVLTEEDRKKLTEKGNKTRLKTRTKKIMQIIDALPFEDWFTFEEALPYNTLNCKDQMFKAYLNDTNFFIIEVRSAYKTKKKFYKKRVFGENQ